MASDEILYHYTTQQGFLGILKDREIWASSILHLNDASEFRYGVDIALRAARTMRMTPDAPQRVQKVISAFQFILDVFVASFSSNGDELGQWRAYGQHGGLSIGFDVASLRTLATRQDYRLQKCNYDPEQHDAEIKKVIEEMVQALPSPEAPFSLLRKFMSLAPIFKHSSFKGEEEWRLFTVLPILHAKRAEFRVGKSFIVPYRKFSLAESPDGPLPIRRIVVGPTPHADLLERTVRACLFNHGVKSSEVVKSDIPYRDW